MHALTRWGRVLLVAVLVWTPGMRVESGSVPETVPLDVSDLKPGRFEATAWIDHPSLQQGMVRQEVPLEKK